MRSLTFTLTGKTKAPRLLLIGLLLVMVSTTVTAQKTVSGVIKNNTDGSPLSKASVQVKGTSRGTTTDENGTFNIQAASDETLVISAIGFAPVEQKVGSTSSFTISLTAATKEMEAVVVTALGISRQQKALGYAAQQVTAEELTDARSNDWSSTLPSDNWSFFGQ